MTSCDKPVKGKFGNNRACYKARDLVRISKVSRRWEGKEGREDCRGGEKGRCKGPRGKGVSYGGKIEAGPHPQCSETKHTPPVLVNMQGEMNVRVLSAPTKQYTQMREC